MAREGFELSWKAREAIKKGSIKIRVCRSGMFQNLTFTIRKTNMGNVSYTELFTERIIDASEISRITNEIGLPLETKNGKAFPNGTTAADFSNL